MSDPRDLVLEQALRTVFDAPLADLSARVVARWHEGRAGNGAPQTEAKARKRRLLTWLVGGALAAAAVLAALLSTPERPQRAALATSDVPLTASAPGAWRPVETTELLAGHTGAAEREVSLTFLGGARLVLAAGSVVQLGGAGDPDQPSAEVQLLVGDATLTSTTSATLHVGEARVALAPGSRLHARTIGFDDPYVIPPATRPLLAMNLHMNVTASATAAVFTLLSGSAVLTDASGTRALATGTPVASQEGTDPVRELLAKEVGKWELVITDYRDGQALPSRTGTEVCSLPSTGEWLLSDMTMERAGEPSVWVHVVLGYAPATRRWSGSLVDSFGGEMALIAGEAGAEPTERVVSMLHFDREDWDTRFVMRWVNDDERVTVIEDRVDGAWVQIREIVHRRHVK